MGGGKLDQKGGGDGDRPKGNFRVKTGGMPPVAPTFLRPIELPYRSKRHVCGLKSRSVSDSLSPKLSCEEKGSQL